MDDEICVERFEDISRYQGFVDPRIFVLVKLLQISLAYVHHLERVSKGLRVSLYLYRGLCR